MSTSLAHRALIAPESDTLVGLSRPHRDGLIAVAVVAGISLITSTALFGHLTRKLVCWHLAARSHRRAEKQRLKRINAQSPGVDLSLGLAPQHFQQQRIGPVSEQGTEDSRNASGGRPTDAGKKPIPREPNQFVVLLYNLLLADIKQSIAFFLNAVWVVRDSIEVGTGTCWAQGLFLSTGDLAGSLFIAAIAVHTYLVAIRGWKPSQRMLILACVSIWLFDYILVFIGFAAANKLNSPQGGFFVRATTWCWINKEFETVRLLTHYLYVFICLALTTIIYTLIFMHLRNLKAKETDGRKSSTTTDPHDMSIDGRHDLILTNKTNGNTSTQNQSDGYNSAFLVYPIIYIICTAPLAIGRIATMAGADLPVTYFCAAGALISLNGFLDTLLWSLTRREVVFGDVDGSAGADGLGLDSFSFMRTPHNRKYGNMIWIEGAGNSAKPGMDGRGDRGSISSGRRGHQGSFWSGLLGSATDGRLSRWEGRGGAQRSVSQQSLRGAAGLGRGETLGGIQMDMVTTVVVEVDPDTVGRMGTSGGGMDRKGSATSGIPSSPDSRQSRKEFASSRPSASGSEKDMQMNMEILNRL